MDLKQQVLGVLEGNRGKSISGTRLAKELFVTRSAIWKAVKALKAEGYHIEAGTNKGYALSDDNQIISSESIRPFLNGDATSFHLEVYDTVTSTNTLAKEFASKGVKEGTVIIAREQTAGKGRMGRTFYSPKTSGIYFSVILRPTLNIEDSLLITTSVAVAVAEAIEQVTAVKAEIKWVNDIFANGKKVCGILTEASLNFEGGGLEYAVVGIGININTNDFPEDMKEVAGSVLSEQSSNALISSRLIAEVLNNIAKSMNSLTSKKYVDEYRKRSFLLGKDIFVLKGKETLPAKAIDIDDKARLIVEYENHLKETLSSGEVSIRIKKIEL